MAEKSAIATIIGVAGAGFRLSLLLNAVGVKLVAANREIQAIAREISLCSLMLKQVGLAMETPGVAASWNALETAKGIAMHHQTIYTEIKDMAEMSQQRDENGNIRSITIASNAQSWFRKPRVQYLLGQLVSLKLTLAIMLQVLQLGKNLDVTRRDSVKTPLTPQEMLQEGAEIQNMVVVRHWSLMDLQWLYQQADDEAAHPHDSPRAESGEMQQIEHDPRLSITATAHDENASKAMVKYEATPLNQLEASLNKTMHQPNQLLHAPDLNIVDRLLREWTRSTETGLHAGLATHHRRAHVETDSDDTDSEFERSNTGGYHLEGPARSTGVVKNVRFRARVEDGEDSDQARPRRRAPKKGIIRSDSDDSSSFNSDSEKLPASRRSSASSTTSRRTSTNDPNGGSSSQRHIPTAGGYGLQGGGAGVPAGLPNQSRGGPPSPRMSRPMPIPAQPRNQPPPGSYQQQHQYPLPPQYPSSATGPPHLPTRPPPPPNATGSGPGLMPGPGPSYIHGPFPPQPRSNIINNNILPPYPQPLPPQSTSFPPPPTYFPLPRRSKPRSSGGGGGGGERSKRGAGGGKASGKGGSSFKENAKKDVKRGLLGAGAVAGLMDILDGLSGI